MEEREGEGNPSWLSSILNNVFKLIAFYLVFQWIRNTFFTGYAAQQGTQSGLVRCDWSLGQRADLKVYLTEGDGSMPIQDDDLVMKKSGIMFGSFEHDQSHEVAFDYEIPKDCKGLTAHVFLVKEGAKIDSKTRNYPRESFVYRKIDMLGKTKRPPITRNLLSESTTSNSTISAETDEVVAFLYPEVYISLVGDATPVNPSALPPHLRSHYEFVHRDGPKYLPTIYMNEIWRLKDKRVFLSDNQDNAVSIKIAFNPMSKLKFQLLTNFDQSLRINESLFGADGESEKMKQMLFETNPYLLIITLAVSLLHSIFDFLAFKNDIQFWKKKDNLQGLSVRSVLINAGFQLIIFLYLLDQEASWMVLGSMTIGTIIELWKITKVLSISVTWPSPGFLPRIQIQDKASYSQSLTQKYDDIAMKYLGLAALPLLVGYSIYSLFTQSHKGWYSWLIGTLVGFVYTFGILCIFMRLIPFSGFITMTPQLFINYKLKSVAHMPWRVFVYKALNTFIDDLFAFIIKMPTLHRLACFRDDIIFVVYLYQRWKYPVDKSRANEFGQVFEGESDEAKTKAVDNTAIANEKSEKAYDAPKNVRRSARLRKTVADAE